MLIEMSADSGTLVVDTGATPKNGDRVVAHFADPPSWGTYRLCAAGALSRWEPFGDGSGTGATDDCPAPREMYRVVAIQYA